MVISIQLLPTLFDWRHWAWPIMVQKKFQAIVKISEKTFGAYTPYSLVRPFCRYAYTFSYVCPCHLCKIPLHIFWA